MSRFGKVFEWTVVMEDGRKISGREEFHTGRFTLKRELPQGTILRIKGRVAVDISDEETIFLNGYQTWTHCKEFNVDNRLAGLAITPKAGISRFALDRYGDYHFMPYSNIPGKLHGYSYGHIRHDDGNISLFGSVDETNGYTVILFRRDPNRLLFSRDVSGLRFDGGEFTLFDIFFAEGDEDTSYDAWFDAMDIKPKAAKPIAGYSSWYNRYQKIDIDAIKQDLEGAKNVLSEGDLFQIDDGWECFIGDWDADENKFPDGMAEAANMIHDAGFKAGLWLAPFVAEEKSDLYKNHKDWFLKVPSDVHEPCAYKEYVLPPYEYRVGSPWKSGCNWSGFYALDIDNPEVIEYLKKVFKAVREWGYDLVKLDFLYAAAPFGTADETRYSRMKRGVDLLRELCGDMMILGCGVPLYPAFGAFEYCRVSCDVSLSWDDVFYMKITHRERPSTKHAIMTDKVRAPLDKRAFGCDPDVFFLRTENLSLSDEQKEAMIEVAKTCGSVFLTSDDMSKYGSDEIRRYKEARQEFENRSK